MKLFNIICEDLICIYHRKLGGTTAGFIKKFGGTSSTSPKGVDGLQINPKLRIITRSDLPLGYQAVQSGHAAIQFQHEHRRIAKRWYNKSNYLIFLYVNNVTELTLLAERSKSENIRVSVFREPDLNNEITAIALEPSTLSDKITSKLKLLK